MKVLMINGSPHENGCTKRALDEVARELNAAGIGTRIMTVGGGQKVKHGCIACSSCSKLHKCVFDDSVNEAIEEMNTSDGIVIGSPVYFASANGTLGFLSGQAVLRGKSGAQPESRRRGRFGAQRRKHGDFRRTEQISLHNEHVRARFHILESGARQYPAGGRTGFRMPADHAHARKKHGVFVKSDRKKRP